MTVAIVSPYSAAFAKREARPKPIGAHLTPDRRVDREAELTREFDDAVISLVAEISLVIDVEERNARFQRRIEIAPTGDQNVGFEFVEGVDQRLLIIVGDHLRVGSHQVQDARLVFLGRFLGAGGDHDHAQILQRGNNRPGFVPRP